LLRIELHSFGLLSIEFKTLLRSALHCLVRPPSLSFSVSPARYKQLLWRLLTPLCLSAKEASPGKSSFLHPMPGTSTDIRLLATSFVMMCLLTLLYLPRMYFLFVGTGFCSLASFTPAVAGNELATY